MSTMRRRLLALALPAALQACAGQPKGAVVPANFDPDAHSGADGKRSGARSLSPNQPITDEVNYQSGDKTDWYRLDLRGKPGILELALRWDNSNSDVMIDVFDEFGAPIANSPVRAKGVNNKSLLAQIDKIGVYYVRVTAPNPVDGSVYTMEAKWEQPAEPPPPITRTHDEAVHSHHTIVHEIKESKPRGGETVEGRILQAYHDGTATTLQINKGGAAGVRVGATGTVLNGSGAEPLSGGSFKIVQVVDQNRSIGKTQLRSIGRNTRVLITLSR